jgi:formylglycine-generating enzyme required for sulfatase activity
LIGLVAGGIVLAGSLLGGNRAPASTAAPTAPVAAQPTETQAPTAAQPSVTPLPAGFTPITSNAEWKPVYQEFSGVKMALAPKGCFGMGSNDGDNNEKPVHQVCFDKPYWIDVTEVTNAQFARLGGQAARASNWTGDNRPRETITWTESDDFCRRRDARLPSEAEWEYAARGPDSLTYPWGNAFVSDNAVWNTSQTADVGSKPQGAAWVGALDMSGNVWEWVNDWYDQSTYGTLSEPATNPQGPGSGQYRALRGGSWNLALTGGLRAADRLWDTPGYGDDSLGFRCARSY